MSDLHNGRVVDHFRLDLVIHHPSCDPDSISLALGLTPRTKLMAGRVIGSITQKSTLWTSRFRSGSTGEEFAQALEDLLAFLETRKAYWDTFILQDGEIQLSINQNIVWDDGKLMELKLEPYFIQELGKYPIGLTVQAWSSEDKVVIDHG